MRIYTRGELYWDELEERYKLLKAEFYEYDGKVALAGGGGGGGGSEVVSLPPQTTNFSSSTKPWSEQIPYLQAGFAKAKNLFLDNMPPIFPNDMSVKYSPETETALDLASLRALNGSPIIQSAQNQLYNTMNGQYLDNPTTRGNFLHGGAGFDAAVNAATRKIIPTIDSAYNKAGRFNSGLTDVARTQAISDSFAGQYGQERQLQEQAYQNERDKQMQSLFFTPQISSMDYEDFSRLGQVGQLREQMMQNQLNEQMYRYNYPYQIPRDQLMQYMPLVQGNYGGDTSGTSTTTGLSQVVQNQGGGNGLLGAIGGGLALAGAFF